MQNDLDQAKTAGPAFPSVKQNLDTLNEVLHGFMINKKDQEANRKLALQEQELAETMRVANNRLRHVEAKSHKLEELNSALEAEQIALVNAKRAVEDQLDSVTTAKKTIEVEKAQLGQRTDELEKDKEKLRIENEQLDVKKKKMEEALKEVNTYLESQKTTLETKKTEPAIASEEAEPEQKEATSVAAKTYLAGLMERVNYSLGL